MLAIFLLIVVSLSVIVTIAIAANYYRDFPAPNPQPTIFIPTFTETPTPTPTQTSTLPPSVTPTPETNSKCIHSPEYWAYNPDVWPYQIVVGNFTYTKEEAQNIYASEANDTRTKLFIQFHAAILNYLSVKEQGAIEKYLREASEWLNNHPAENEIPASDLDIGNGLAKILKDYNYGFSGLGLCADDPYQKGFPTKIPETTAPSEQTATPDVTDTATPTPTRTQPRGTYVIPTETTHPTKKPPTRTPPPPPNTPPPQPTNPPPTPPTPTLAS